jgi:hypothetical protein
MTLTDKELQLLDSIKEGMDQPGCGWLWELNPFSSDKICAGVLSSLIKKGLVHSYQDEESPDCYWIEIAM